MERYFVLRLATINKKAKLTVALMHNKRVNMKEVTTIDSTRTSKNYSLPENKTVDQVNQQFRQLTKAAGIKKFRKNGVVAVELMISLSKGANTDIQPFFKDTYDWVSKFFGVPILSFDVHLDENYQHCHVLLLPLVNNKMKGSKVVGNRAKISEAKQSFYEHVGKKYEILPASKAPSNLNIIREKIFEIIENDIIKKSILWSIVERLINEKPKEFSELLKSR